MGAGLAESAQVGTAWAAPYIRHFLPEVSWVQGHGGFLEGEIAARAQQDVVGDNGFEYLQGGQVVGKIADEERVFPNVRTFAYSRFSASGQTVKIDAGSVFEFDNGERIRLTDAEPDAYGFPLSGINTISNKWNYLYLKKSAGMLSVVATMMYGHLEEATLGEGDFAYLGAAYVDGTSAIRPIRRIGTRYFYRHEISVDTDPPPSAVSLLNAGMDVFLVPETAVKAQVWGMNRGIVSPYLRHFCPRFGAPVESCTTGLFEANRAQDGKIRFFIQAFASGEQGPITVQIQGFEEGLETLR